MPTDPTSHRRPIKIGIQLPEVEREFRWPEIRAMARVADEAGFDSLWVGDHLLYHLPNGESRGPWEAWTQLAGLAEATTHIELGPLVAATSFHAPTMLAKMAATVDEISGGRLILGLGAGWNAVEYEAFGFPFDHRISRFEEAFTIIRTLLRDGAIDFDGTYYQARDCELLPRSARPGGPPLLIGSSGPRMLAITMPYADAWNAWYDTTGNSPAGIAPLRAGVDEACRAAGRDPSEVERSVAVYVRLSGGKGRIRGAADSETVDPLEGPTDVLAEAFRAYASEGVSHLQLVTDPISAASIEALVPVLELLDGG